jgi:protein-tyrosine phosphatase
VTTRHLDWDGCHNVRDLGGLRTRDGGVTRRGAVVRSDAVDRLTRPGWDALVAHGVRTVIDLRNDDERAPDAAPRPELVTTLELPLDGTADTAFWSEWGSGPQIGTPLYYGPFLACFPERTAAVVGAVARARPGGVLLHCRAGRDRVGLATLVLLAVTGVEHDEIADDHGLSHERVSALAAALGEPDQRADIEAELQRRGTTSREAILGLLAGLDAEAYLRGAGVDLDDLAALRSRLLA